MNFVKRKIHTSPGTVGPAWSDIARTCLAKTLRLKFNARPNIFDYLSENFLNRGLLKCDLAECVL